MVSIRPTAATKAFDAAMDDDFNTPEAIAALQGLARELNSVRRPDADSHKANLAGELRAWAACWASCGVPPEQMVPRRGHRQVVWPMPKSMRWSRPAWPPRKARNYAESDRIRDQLAAAGVILEDKPGGLTSWRRG